MSSKLKIAVVMGGPSSEHDISLETGKQILEYLDREKYDAIPVKISRENEWYVDDDKREIRQIVKSVDLVFNAMHGQFGEDGRLQALLDYFQVSYTGSGVTASALAFDKIRSRELFRFNKITVPASIIFHEEKKTGKEVIKLIRAVFENPPWVIKPARSGSSVGISIARDEKSLLEAFKLARKHDKEVLVEEYLSGREFTCGILENFDGEKLFAFPVVEIIPPDKYEFFDYEAKYNPETQEIVPANIPDNLARNIQDIARKAHDVLGCKTYSRSDMITRDDTVYLLETNTLPGLTSASIFPKEAQAVGLTFSELLDKIIEGAISK